MDELHKMSKKERPSWTLLFSYFRAKINTVCLDENKECEVRLYGYFGKSAT